MEALRFQVVGEAFKKKPLDVKAPSERPYEYFGKKAEIDSWRKRKEAQEANARYNEKDTMGWLIMRMNEYRIRT